MRLRGHCRAGTAVAETHYCSSAASEKKGEQLLPHGRPATPIPRPLPRTPQKAWWCQAAPPVVGSPVTCGGGGRAEQRGGLGWEQGGGRGQG